MDKLNIFTIVYFLTFAVVDFVIYAILSKYLYMSGGATRQDVKIYLNEQGTNGQRRLVEWLRRRTPQPVMFENMFRVCSVLSGVAFFSSVLIMILNIYKSTTVIFTCCVIVAVVSIVTSLYGFLYSKKVKENLSSYFDSSYYRPYTGEEFFEYTEDEFGLYELSEKPTVSFTQAEKEKVDKQVKYGQQIAIFITFAIIISIPIISLNQSGSDVNSDETTTETTTETTQQEQRQQITSISDVKAIFDFLNYSIDEIYSETKELFSDFDFIGCIGKNGEEIYFGFYELDSEESAIELQKNIKTKIINDNNAEAFDGQDKSYENFTIYSYETDDIYAVSICCENCVIYAYSDELSEAWLKFMLHELGYLEDF